jgi:hypothetical protein
MYGLCAVHSMFCHFVWQEAIKNISCFLAYVYIHVHATRLSHHDSLDLTILTILGELCVSFSLRNFRNDEICSQEQACLSKIYAAPVSLPLEANLELTVSLSVTASRERVLLFVQRCAMRGT